jgi:hypothetical protein
VSVRQRSVVKSKTLCLCSIGGSSNKSVSEKLFNLTAKISAAVVCILSRMLRCSEGVVRRKSRERRDFLGLHVHEGGPGQRGSSSWWWSAEPSLRMGRCSIALVAWQIELAFVDRYALQVFTVFVKQRSVVKSKLFAFLQQYEKLLLFDRRKNLAQSTQFLGE